jgi:hypothetical protein
LKLNLTRGVLRRARKADSPCAGTCVEGPLNFVGRDTRHDTSRGRPSGFGSPLSRLIQVEIG